MISNSNYLSFPTQSANVYEKAPAQPAQEKQGTLTIKDKEIKLTHLNSRELAQKFEEESLDEKEYRTLSISDRASQTIAENANSPKSPPSNFWENRSLKISVTPSPLNLWERLKSRMGL